MLTQYGVLKPDIPRAGYQDEVVERWRQERTLREESLFDPLAINARFTHDPSWRERLFSVQCVIDSRKTFDWRLLSHWIWGVVSMIFYAANIAFVLVFGWSFLFHG